LRETAALLAKNGWGLVNLDATIIAQEPRMAPHIAEMIVNIAADLGVAKRDVSVKAKTTDKLGFTGRGEGIAAEAIALIARMSADGAKVTD
ncbi:MAG TPA: 2-C-methyl-D-erythritol 2,4-cyclodiphosphate synthase, partial [Burkholderiales bacterium]|jgi:2-C-methyl-D-erythritol 2,4-cyclodiphosphate synthase|nr:2-C-methyl-D-erythritol 2,4-cyclodiphosphate synthase [Burkholderiales bacterium]